MGRWIAGLVAAVMVSVGGVGCSGGGQPGGGSSDGGGTTGSTTGGTTGGSGSGSSGGMATGSGSGTTGGTTAGDAGGDADGGGGACGPRLNYVEVYQPNIFMVVDRSESMEGQKMAQAKQGLDTVAEAIADKVRIGVGGYPMPSAGCSSRELLELGVHASADIKQSYADLTAAGGTPTGIALYQVRQGMRLTDRADSNEAKRAKAVILITDGNPNDQQVCRQTVKQATNQAAKLKEGSLDASVYVIGYQSNADAATLNQIAEAGGTDAPGPNKFYEAGGASELADAITKIANGSVSCSFEIDPPVPEGASVGVKLDGQTVPRSNTDGFQYFESTARVQVTGSWCQTLQQKGEEGAALEINVGCPTCSLAGESCQSASDCCRGECQGGTCVEACHALGESCAANGDCCSMQCAGRQEGELIGECVGG